MNSYEIRGFSKHHPVIEKVSFAFKDKIALHLREGRVLLAPLQNFPSIEQLSPTQRRKLTILDDQLLMFQDCDEIFIWSSFWEKNRSIRTVLTD